MAVLDDVKELLGKYASGAAPAGDAGAHFQQVAQSVDSSTLAGGIAAALRSDKTAPFSQLVSKLFASGSGEQKTAMLSTLLSALPADQRAKVSSMIPALGGASSDLASPAAEGVSAKDVQQLAQHVEKQDGTIVDKMSALYAAHPALIKTLGASAMAIAMRKIAQNRQNG
ncbi:MAG TPA: hypothetical protein VLV86_16135 [Vicinamibacterales bacterium]|nr:hypothetical protein [Vicinamibacterales bacterium]